MRSEGGWRRVASKGKSFEFQPGSLRRNLRVFDGNVNALVAGVVVYRAAASVGWMKNSAKWVDRTGNARATLAAYSIHGDNFHEIHLHGGVPYQIWIELARNGKYKVIRRAVIIQGLALMNMLRGLTRRLGKS